MINQAFSKRFRRPRSIRFQLVLTVNLVMVLAISALLFARYSREIQKEIYKKHMSLNDEAIVIHATVSHMWGEHDVTAVQKTVNSICQRMQTTRLPCHHIVVRRKNQIIQSQDNILAHEEDLVRVIESAGESLDHQVELANKLVVVGKYESDGVSVLVSENLDEIRRAIRRDVLTQLAVVGLLGVVAAGIVNLVLFRIVEIPLQGLLTTVQQIGEGKLGAEHAISGSHELQLLSDAVNSMSRQLMESDKERQLQMQKAQQIQQHLLPNGIQIPGLQTADIFEPADQVAGDYYDFLPLSDGSWLICVADVTGHGIPAAMGAAMLKSLLLTASERYPFDPVSILKKVNLRFVQTVLPGNFASMFLARWEPNTRNLSWASAGHEPGLLMTQQGQIELLNSSGMLLGLTSDADWEMQSVILEDGDKLLLFSDGITDVQNTKGEFFGREQLTQSFSECVRLPVDEIVSKVDRAIRNHRIDVELKDDLTLVVLQCEINELAPLQMVCNEQNKG